jgi:hypothetical protein
MVYDAGDFIVEWHLLAGIKVIYGLGQGTFSKFNCIYYSQECVKNSIGTIAQARTTFSMRSATWKGGLFSKKFDSKPIACMLEFQRRWKPILAISLERVHMCALHAFNRIVEKIVHLHFQLIWTLRDKDVQRRTIVEMQKVLSSTGVHEINVIIFKDEQILVK